MRPLQELGYKVPTAATHSDFLIRFSQVHYQVVILEELFAANSITENLTLQTLQHMPMSQRRHAAVILFGASFQTFTPMQAFQQSVNAVINPSEIFLLKQLIEKSVADNDFFLTSFREAQANLYAENKSALESLPRIVPDGRIWQALGHHVPPPPGCEALVERGLLIAEKRRAARSWPVKVTISLQPARKPGQAVQERDKLALTAPEKFVSRGGFKLEHALFVFKLDVAGQTAADLGASTGGFTDCLLQHGVARVYAVDVGQGQLAWKLRRDPRVVVMEKTNARNLAPAAFPQPFSPVDLVVIDCSFISLTRILPATCCIVAAVR